MSYALDVASAAQRRVLDGIGRRDLTQSDVDAIIATLTDTGALAHNEREIHRLLDEAHTARRQLPYDETSLEALGALADYVAPARPLTRPEICPRSAPWPPRPDSRLVHQPETSSNFCR